MKIAVASVQVPFVYGGGELMCDQLVHALRDGGHSVELITMPFRFGPASAVERSMDMWAGEDFLSLGFAGHDLVIPLKFPAIYLQHPNKVCWLMHQHRSVYELWNTPYGDSSEEPEMVRVRDKIRAFDSEHLGAARKVFTISQRVTERLQEHNGVVSEPLLQPPPKADQYYCDEQLPYILVPSRLETLKRQALAIRALCHTNPSVQLVIVGSGGQEPACRELVDELELVDRVLFCGQVSRRELIAWYANALAVFFAPFDEDYGFVTLEAMLSEKPLITCSDSGGPLSFLIDKETGFVCEPDAEAVAAAFDALWADRRLAERIGKQARAHYDTLNLSWAHIVDQLTRTGGQLI